MTPDIMEKAQEVYCELRRMEYNKKLVSRDFINLIAAALAEARAVPQWLPIESAPKDGTEILAYEKECVFITSWDDSPDGCINYHKGFYSGRKGFGSKGAPLLDYPTHWQPLPAAPNPPIAGDK